MTTVSRDINTKLGILIQKYRADRPDEWTMDEFTREAEAMGDKIAELEARIVDLDKCNHSAMGMIRDQAVRIVELQDKLQTAKQDGAILCVDMLHKLYEKEMCTGRRSTQHIDRLEMLYDVLKKAKDYANSLKREGNETA